METKQNLRKVACPDKLYIQINDEDEKTLSFSFNDDPEKPIGINPNCFDDVTIHRAMYALRCVYNCLYRVSIGKEEIKPLKE